jgi:hypothetical protein
VGEVEEEEEEEEVRILRGVEGAVRTEKACERREGANLK